MPMPGIMYHMDGFEKRIVDAHYQAKGSVPKWLRSLGCIEPVSFPRKMTQEYPKLGLTLVGMPDAVFKKTDGTLCLVDYKTAKYKGADDPFMPGYEAQLWGYAQLLRDNQIGNVSSAALVYFENTLADCAEKPLELLTNDGFYVPFKVKIHPVEIDLPTLKTLLKTFREYVDMPHPPEGSERCKTCQRLERLFDVEGQLDRKEKATKSLQDHQGELLRSELTRWELERSKALVFESMGWEKDLEDDFSRDMDAVPAEWDI
jgi:hypothetical protein